MKIFVKYAIEEIIKIFLYVFYCFPIRKDRIIFSAYSGRQYSGSPKCLSDVILQLHPDYQQIWAFLEPEKFSDKLPQNIKIVKYKSLRYLYYALTSQIYIDNVEHWSILRFRKDQIVLNTWHGGGVYKQVGADRLDTGAAEKRHVVKKMSQIDLFFSSSLGFSEYVIRGAFKYQGEILPFGLPRNDIFFNSDSAKIQQIRQSIGLTSTQKMVLYAPTFRNAGSSSWQGLDFSMLRDSLSRRFGGKWVVVTRLHYYRTSQIKETDFSEAVIDASFYPDMQDLLLATDVLITDYSSSIWDFSFTKRPCFLFTPDLAEYYNERNFYTSIYDWPFPLAKTNLELAEVIDEFSEDIYHEAIFQHHKEVGSYETGHATIDVCHALFDRLEAKRK